MADERELLRESTRRILENDKGLADQIDKLRGLATHSELRSTLEGVRDRVGAARGPWNGFGPGTGNNCQPGRTTGPGGGQRRLRG